ncbi:hypothetical protein HHI36_002038, partial [Cryptolaemus montrouzieri]
RNYMKVDDIYMKFGTAISNSDTATPFAQPIIAASKSKAQKQREYRQRIAASRTPAPAQDTLHLKHSLSFPTFPIIVLFSTV